jgi:hypothetical protein
MNTHFKTISLSFPSLRVARRGEEGKKRHASWNVGYALCPFISLILNNKNKIITIMARA